MKRSTRGPFTRRQQDALRNAFEIICRRAQTLEDHVQALEVALVSQGTLSSGSLAGLREAIHDARDLEELVHPGRETVRREIGRLFDQEEQLQCGAQRSA